MTKQEILRRTQRIIVSLKTLSQASIEIGGEVLILESELIDVEKDLASLIDMYMANLYYNRNMKIVKQKELEQKQKQEQEIIRGTNRAYRLDK